TLPTILHLPERSIRIRHRTSNQLGSPAAGVNRSAGARSETRMPSGPPASHPPPSVSISGARARPVLRIHRRALELRTQTFHQEFEVEVQIVLEVGSGGFEIVEDMLARAARR